MSLLAPLKTAFSNIRNYDDLLFKLSEQVAKIPKHAKQALVTASSLVTAATGVCMFSSVTQHQAPGNVFNVIEGIADCTQEKYYENGGTQSGTWCTSAGQFIRSLGINAYNIALRNRKSIEWLEKKIPGCGKVLPYVTDALILAEVASGVHEVSIGDGDKVQDGIDTADGVLNTIGLLATRRRLASI